MLTAEQMRERASGYTEAAEQMLAKWGEQRAELAKIFKGEAARYARLAAKRERRTQ